MTAARVLTVGAAMEVQATYYRSLFALVQNARDWRAPVESLVPAEIANDVMGAVEFMTGAPVIRESTKNPKVVRISSIGYRAGPCGP